MNTEKYSDVPKLPDPPKNIPELGVSDTKAIEEHANFESQAKQVVLASYIQLQIQREKFGKYTFRLMVGWLVAVLLIVILSGFSIYEFKLPEAALVTLIGSTTLNILGLMVIVLRFVFSPHPLDAMKIKAD